MHLLASVSSKGTGSFDQASLFSYISQFFDCAMYILKKVSSQCPFNLFLLHNHFHLSWLVVIESFILFCVFCFFFSRVDFWLCTTFYYRIRPSIQKWRDLKMNIFCFFLTFLPSWTIFFLLLFPPWMSFHGVEHWLNYWITVATLILLV